MGAAAGLIITAALPVLLSALLYIGERRWLRDWAVWKRQLIAGLLFGALAISGTELGVDVGGAVINARDAAPLCAGLLFGGGAGVLSGLIGGVERWFAVYWGVGRYTRTACSLATVLAGLFAAALRRFLLEGKKPSWAYGLFAGVVMEVLHMLLIFLTNMSDIAFAFAFVETCSLPMIVLNACSVTLAVSVVSLLGRRREDRHRSLRQISQTFQRWLALVVTAAFLVTTAFSLVLQTRLAQSSAEDLLSLNLEDVRQEIRDQSDNNLINAARWVADDLLPAIGEAEEEDIDALLREAAGSYRLAEINLVNGAGIITHSTYAPFVGYHMRTGEQSREFLQLVDGTLESYAQAYGPVSYDLSLFRKYAGLALEGGGCLQVGQDGDAFQGTIDALLPDITRNRHIGETGSFVVANAQGEIVSDPWGHTGEHVEAVGLWTGETPTQGRYFTAQVNGVTSYCSYDVSEGYYIIAVLPWAEVFALRNISVYLTVFMEIVIFAVLFILVYFLIKKLIVENIRRINQSLARITGGDLNVRVDVRANEEFASLSDDINSTVVTLKHYIAEAAARIDQELEYARAIQLSAMPRVFPPYPSRTEFDIFAAMRTAKEVGGDFYDFYLLGEDRLAFLIADVSGKGIPAAMFMMTAKTLLKSLAESGLPVEEVFTEANDRLSDGNDAGMFVTAWMGILELRTGLVHFANAGHNPPALRDRAGAFRLLTNRPSLVLAGMEGIRYRRFTLQLEPGDTLFLYTDGVTEATDSAQSLYSSDRLISTLDRCGGLGVEALCAAVQEDVDAFAGDAPQFDDITMLALRWRGASEEDRMETLTLQPELSEIGRASALAEEALARAGAPAKVTAQVNIAIDELLSNVIRCGGASEITFALRAEPGRAVLRLTDDGIPYDPTAAEEPDTTLSAEERQIGGLGLLMVRRTMDRMEYARREGQNCLLVEKRWQTE